MSQKSNQPFCNFVTDGRILIGVPQEFQMPNYKMWGESGGGGGQRVLPRVKELGIFLGEMGKTDRNLNQKNTSLFQAKFEPVTTQIRGKQWHHCTAMY
jgi:hypothetical protein